jgi:response regulator of citrate/malate metabolism
MAFRRTYEIEYRPDALGDYVIRPVEKDGMLVSHLAVENYQAARRMYAQAAQRLQEEIDKVKGEQSDGKEDHAEQSETPQD